MPVGTEKAALFGASAGGAISEVELLVVAGAGGGGLNGGGGGGAGGYRTNASFAVEPGVSIAVAVGNGGSANESGSTSTFSTISSSGGGGGGGSDGGRDPGAGGSVPDVTSGSGKIDIYTFFTLDAGTIWYGFQAGADMATPS